MYRQAIFTDFASPWNCVQSDPKPKAPKPWRNGKELQLLLLVRLNTGVPIGMSEHGNYHLASMANNEIIRAGLMKPPSKRASQPPGHVNCQAVQWWIPTSLIVFVLQQWRLPIKITEVLMPLLERASDNSLVSFSLFYSLSTTDVFFSYVYLQSPAYSPL